MQEQRPVQAEQRRQEPAAPDDQACQQRAEVDRRKGERAGKPARSNPWILNTTTAWFAPCACLLPADCKERMKSARNFTGRPRK